MCEAGHSLSITYNVCLRGQCLMYAAGRTASEPRPTTIQAGPTGSGEKQGLGIAPNQKSVSGVQPQGRNSIPICNPL